MSGAPPDWKPSRDGKTLVWTDRVGRLRGTRRTRTARETRAPLDDVPAASRTWIVRWARKTSAERRIDSLMGEVPLHEIANAETAIDMLLDRGWVEVIERFADQDWRRSAISFLDLPALRSAVGLVDVAAAWRDAATEMFDSPELAAAVGRQPPLAVAGLTAPEVLRRLARVRELADQPVYLRQVAAQLFGGRSKVLDGREALIAAVLGCESCPFPEIPIRLDVYLPRAWHGGVLFIENPLAFDAAWRTPFAACSGYALVLAQGFLASARRVRSRRTSSIYALLPTATEDAERFSRWLFDAEGERETFFWGDLDYSGMSILRELRAVFAGMRAWEPGYAPMLRAIQAGDGHPPEETDKKNQQRPESTGCKYADDLLLQAMERCGLFFDQEGVVPEERKATGP